MIKLPINLCITQEVLVESLPLALGQVWLVRDAGVTWLLLGVYCMLARIWRSTTRDMFLQVMA